MSGLSYRYRAHPFARAWTYRLGETELMIHDGARERSVPFADVTFIESFDVHFAGRPESYSRHILRTRHGRPIVLSAGFRDPWRVADKRREYQIFISKLLNALHAVDPDREYVHGRRLLNRAGGLGGKLAVRLLRAVRHTNPDRCADIAAWIMRRLGPRLRGHRRALEQIALAFPDMPAQEREKIAVGMWENLARTAIEYATLETHWRHDPDDPEPPRVIAGPSSLQNLKHLKAAKRRALIFSLHLANWELAAISGPEHGLRVFVPFRRLKNQELTEEIVRLRTLAGTTPVPAGPLMVPEIRKRFEEGDMLGMLIDQYYAEGVEVTFFGRPTRFNPLFARLARLYECPVYAGRIIRRPDHRFEFELMGPIEPARDARGRVDVHASMQIYASVMERWIREHPEQWLWLHRAWR